MYSLKNSQYTMISIRLCSARARCDSIGAARGASARAARAGVLMAIMALLLPGGTAQGLGGGLRWGQRLLRACLHVRKSPERFGAS